MKCTICHTQFEAKRADAKFCSPRCRQRATRGNVTDKLSVTQSIFPVTDKREPILRDSKVGPDTTFTPNWVRHGFKSKEEAIAQAIKAVRESKGVINSALY